MAEATVTVKPDTIVMIHGLWMTPRSWEHWKERYEARGYTVHAPAWPGFEVEVEALNADPSPMNDLRAETVIDAYEAFIRELRSDPIIMGHSLGRRDHAGAVEPRPRDASASACPSATVKGIRDLPWSTLKAAGPALEPVQARQARAAVREGVPLRLREHDERGGVQAALRALRRAGRARACSPTSRSRTCTGTRRPRSTSPRKAGSRCCSSASARTTSSRRRPRCTTSGSTTTRSRSPSTRSSRAARTSPGAPGWEEVADFAIDWAERHAGLTVAEHTAEDPVSGG